MKKPIILLSLVAALVGALTLPALAGDTGTVTATVSAVVISVQVSPTSISYGTLPVGSTNAAPLSGSPLDVTNNGTVAEDFDIVGFDTDDWTLKSAAGANQYVHRFSTNGTTFTALTTVYQDLASDVQANGLGVINVHLRMDLPLTTSTANTQSAKVSIRASQHTP